MRMVLSVSSTGRAQSVRSLLTVKLVISAVKGLVVRRVQFLHCAAVKVRGIACHASTDSCWAFYNKRFGGIDWMYSSCSLRYPDI